MSAAEWKQQQAQRARMAMPGAPREVALRSRPGEAPVHAAPRTSRGYPTGAGTEPLRLWARRATRACRRRSG